MMLDERSEDVDSSDEDEDRSGMNIDNLGMDNDDGDLSPIAGKYKQLHQ